MLTDGIKRNCEKCGACYGQYKEDKETNFNESWSEAGQEGLETKGLCQFCNPKSKYYNKLD